MMSFWYSLLQTFRFFEHGDSDCESDSRKRKLDRFSDDEEEDDEEDIGSPKHMRMGDSGSEEDVRIIYPRAQNDIDCSNEPGHTTWEKVNHSNTKENRPMRSPEAPKTRPPLRSSHTKNVKIADRGMNAHNGSDDDVEILEDCEDSPSVQRKSREAAFFREPPERSIPISKKNYYVPRLVTEKTSHTLKMQSPGKSRSLPSVERAGAATHKSLRGVRSPDHQDLRNNLAVTQCVRLDEKRTYQSLLQQFTTVPIPLVQNGSLHSWKSSDSSFDDNGKSRVVTRSDFTRTIHRNCLASKMPLVDLTNEPSTNDVEIIDVKKNVQNKSPITQARKQGLKDWNKDGTSLPKYSPINSLKTKLGEPVVFNDSFTKDLDKLFAMKSMNRAKQIEEQKVIAENMRAAHERERLRSCEERIRRHLVITEVEIPDEEEEAVVEVPALPVITEQMEAKIKAALRPEPGSQVLVSAHKLQICRRDMNTLASLNWLNDEVINFYTSMIAERSEKGNLPKTYAFSTFFYTRLMGGGHAAVKRWTKKVDLFAYDLILIPVHLGMHWCLAVADLRKQVVKYYDSMGGENKPGLKAILKYLESESLDKKKVSLDTSGWTLENVKKIPQQMNGSDCGMFACKYAEYVSRDADITFSQQDMPFFRRLMVYEILNNQIL